MRVKAAAQSYGAQPEILVVEPSGVSGRSALDAVRNLGYAVRVAKDTQVAWRLLLDRPSPVVVVTAASREAAVDFCRRVRSVSFDRYVYLITVLPADGRTSPYTTLEAGADVQLPDPVELERLRWVLRGAERILELERNLRSANLQLRDANGRLARVARLDPLMQIGSRLAFEDKIREVHNWADANDRFYAVVMCDLDHFKCYNDTLGHQQGDEILRRVAEAIEDAIRASDYAFRYGGEEVVLLLIDQDLEAAGGVAERVRRHVEAVEFEVADGELPFRVTVSCGVASYPENSRPGGDWRLIVEGADQALYIAKGSGRNRVAVTKGSSLQVLSQLRGGAVVEDSAGDGSARVLRPAHRI